MAPVAGEQPNRQPTDDGQVPPRSWWVLALIVLSYGAYNLDKSIVSILIEPLKAEFALSDSQMGLLAGMATSVPFALACIPVGLIIAYWLARRRAPADLPAAAPAAASAGEAGGP